MRSWSSSDCTARRSGPSSRTNWKSNLKSARAQASSAAKGMQTALRAATPTDPNPRFSHPYPFSDGTTTWTPTSTKLRSTRPRRRRFSTCTRSLEISGPTSQRTCLGDRTTASRTITTRRTASTSAGSTRTCAMLKFVSAYQHQPVSFSSLALLLQSSDSSVVFHAFSGGNL